MQLRRLTAACAITMTLCIAAGEGVAGADTGAAGPVSTESAATSSASGAIDLTAPVASGPAAAAAPSDSSASNTGATNDQQSGAGADSQAADSAASSSQAGATESSGSGAVPATGTQATNGSTGVPLQAPASLGPTDDLGALATNAKRKEHARACKAHIRNAAFMSRAHADLVAYDAGGSWTEFALALGLAAAVLVGAAFALKRRAMTRGHEMPPAKGLLETAGMFVAVCGGIAALAAQFIPGVGVHSRPAPSVEMAVRKVDARITRAEFARALQSTVAIRRADRSELGNVVWLALHVRGYEGQPLFIDYGPYVAHALVGRQKPMIRLPTPQSDDEATVLPIWIPYPSDSKVFQAQFRLIDRNGVREIAGTGDMRGPKYRYACP